MDEDYTSYHVDLSQFDTHGFCKGYQLRRHRYEYMANIGCHQARSDWGDLISPTSKFGGCNPVNGNFNAVVLPLCKPERLELVSYILEYAFLHDNVVENLNITGQDEFSLSEAESNHSSIEIGRKQLQAKMILQLLSTDKKCANRVLQVWRKMLSTTVKDKSTEFESIEQYLDFRIVDTGGPFVESIMLFGMGLALSEEEDSLLADIVRPCYASLALANDYFSFDREWEEAQLDGTERLTNAVWLYMRWTGADIPTAKNMVRDACNQYEDMFLQLCRRETRPDLLKSKRIDLYLRGLSYQVSGNVVWSLNCPRYHPEFRYDANAGLENLLSRESCGKPDEIPRLGQECEMEVTHSVSSSSAGSESSINDDRMNRVSSPTTSIDSDSWTTASVTDPNKECLGLEHVQEPVSYIENLPSKGVREEIIDGINLWARLPERVTNDVKDLVKLLHSASLMLDDIEDGSELRRGHPSTHSVFGVPQTINAGSFAIVDALTKASKMDIPNSVGITLEQLRDLHVGQSYDLYWTRHVHCPTEAEYLEMVSKKTGGLFRLMSRLMSATLSASVAKLIDHFMIQLGLYFQIRDDYMNLKSEEYTDQKGFCEDLDEGKISFPLVHCLNLGSASRQLEEALQVRREQNKLSNALKRMILRNIDELGGMKSTLGALNKLFKQLEGTLSELEIITGRKNWVFRLLLYKLEVSQ